MKQKDLKQCTSWIPMSLIQNFNQDIKLTPKETKIERGFFVKE